MGNGRGVYRSTNNGTNWTIANNGIPDNSYAYRLAIKDSIIFAAVFGGGLYISTNNGSVWKDCAIGLPYKYAICLAINGSNVYASTPTGVWRRSIQEILTDIREHEDNLPIRFSLYQNYPNPFNPKTRIDYAIPKGSNVIIKVYNSLGEEVETLINEYKAPGSYSINFDGSSLTSGVYFYQLRADKFTLTKKMVLLR